MGTFRIIIQGTGGHGVHRGAQNGETVDFTADGGNTPDALAKEFVDNLAQHATLSEATITHWPGQSSQVLDDLLSGKRAGSF